MSSPRIHLLGRMRIEQAGRSVDAADLGGPRAEILLARLALAGGEVVPRADLADAVWADRLPRSWGAALRNVITTMRTRLRDTGLAADITICTRPNGYLLQLSPEATIDLLDGVALVEICQQATGSGQHGEALVAARRAIELLARPALPGLRGEWAQACRDDAAELRRRALGAGGMAALEVGELRCAEAWAGELVAIAPLREDARRLLMRVLAASGNRAEALRTFERLREVLLEELGTTPSAETEALFAELLDDGDRRPVDASPLRIAANAGRLVQASRETTFVGRTDELAQLGAALDEVLGSGTRIVAMRGEPGAGKTRLAAELMTHAHDRGLRVLYGRSDDRIPIAYGALLDAAGSFVATFDGAEARELLGVSAAVLARVIPSLAVSVEPATPTGVPDLDGLHLVKAIVETLHLASAPNGALVVLDDLQWASAQEIGVIAELPLALGTAPVLLVAIHRDADDAVAESLQGRRRVSRLALDGLGVDEVLALARSLEVHGDEPAERAWRAGGGNPLVAIEVLRRHATGPAGGEGPRRLAEFVADRVQSLPAGAEEVLAVAAVVGLEFDPELVVATSGVDRSEADQVLVDAQRSGLLVPAVGRDGWLAFRHGLVHSALAERIAPDRRTRLHELVGSTVEQHADGASTPELAYHFARSASAAGARRALRYGVEVARVAYGAAAYDDVIAIATRTIDAVSAAGSPTGPDRAGERHDPDVGLLLDLQILLGGAQRAVGDPAGFDTLHAAVATARRRGDSRRLADGALAFVHAGAAADELFVDHLMLGLFEEALEGLDPDDLRRRSQLLGHVAGGRAWRVCLESGRSAATESIETADRLGDPATRAVAVTTARRILSGSFDQQTRVQLEDGLATLAETIDDPGAHTRALLWRFETKLQAGAGSELDDLLDRAERAADGLRMGQYHHTAAYHRAALAMLRDRPDAEAAIERAAEVGRRHGLVGEIVDAIRCVQLIQLRFERGRSGEVLDEAIEFVERHGPSELPVIVAALAAEAGHLDIAERYLERFMGEIDASGLTVVRSEALAATAALPIWRLGAAAWATQLYERLVPHAGLGGYVGYFTGPVDHSLGLLAATTGRLSDAGDHLERGAEFAAGLGARRWEQRCLDARDLLLR